MSTGPRRGRTRQGWTHHKGKRSAPVSEDQVVEDIKDFFEEALQLQPSPLTFNLDVMHDRIALAKAMWVRHDVWGDQSMTAANLQLSSVLKVLLRNKYAGASGESAVQRTNIRIENILIDLQRAQSQKRMPLLTARFSCACLRAQLPRKVWELISLCFPGLLASYSWTEEFVAFASECRPACDYAELEGVGGVLFDNYTRKVLYSSKATIDSSGFLLNMTNWATFCIPAKLASPNFNAKELCEHSVNRTHHALPCDM